MNNFQNLDFQQIINQNTQETFYIIDANTYDLLNMNSTLSRKFSSNADYSNKKCYEFIYKSEKPCSFCKKNQLGLNQSIEWYKYNTKQNSTHLMRDKLIEVDGRLLFVQSSFPITKLADKISSLQEKSKSDNTIIECAKTLANKDDLTKSIDNLLQLICEYQDADCSFLFERNYSIHQSKLSNIYRSPNADLKEFNEIIVTFDTNSKWSKELNEKDYIFITSADLENEYNKYYETFVLTKEFENALIIPIKLNGVVTAFIALNNLKISNNNTDRFTSICTIAMFITNSLFVKHNQEELEGMVITLHSEVELNEVMMKCIRVLLECKDFDSTINTLLELLQDYFYSTNVSILRLNDNTQTLYDWFGQTENSIFSNISLSVLIDWYDNYNNNNIAYIDDISTLNQDEFDKDIASFAITPITKDDKIIGFLRIDNPKANIESLHLLNTITLLIANHIDKVNMTNELERLSYTDDLTGLYNRNYFNSYIQQFNLNNNQNIGVIFADVNSLKLVNDNLGHEYGDKLIRCCASLLKQAIDGVSFRLGGDEFVIICDSISTVEFNDKISDLEKLISNHGEINISIGSSWCQYIDDVEDVVKLADESMYNNKRLYYSTKEQDTRTKEELINALRISIDDF